MQALSYLTGVRVKLFCVGQAFRILHIHCSLADRTMQLSFTDRKLEEAESSSTSRA